MARRFRKAKISFISLCPKGKNQMPVVFKADGAFDWSLLTKASEKFQEDGTILGVVFAPEVRDSEGDIADPAVIKEMCHSFAQAGLQVDIRHDNKAVPREDAYVAENFIIQKGDPRFADFKDNSGNVVDVTGGWGVLIQINKEELRAQYREGKWEGISMAGNALFEVEKSDDGETFFKRLMAGLSGLVAKSNNDGDFDMKPEELKKMLDDQTAALSAAIVKALKPDAPEIKPEDKKVEKEVDPDEPVFTGSKSKLADVKAHAIKLQHYRLQKAIDFDAQPAVLAKAVEALEKFEKANPSVVEKVEGTEDEEDDQIEKSAAPSRQPANDNKPNATLNASPSFMLVGGSLSKADQKAASIGSVHGTTFVKERAAAAK